MSIRLQLERYVPPVRLPRRTLILALLVAFALGINAAVWAILLLKL